MLFVKLSYITEKALYAEHLSKQVGTGANIIFEWYAQQKQYKLDVTNYN